MKGTKTKDWRTTEDTSAFLAPAQQYTTKQNYKMNQKHDVANRMEKILADVYNEACSIFGVGLVSVKLLTHPGCSTMQNFLALYAIEKFTVVSLFF